MAATSRLGLGRDSVLLVGLGLSAIATIAVMRRMLIHYRDAAKIPPLENKSQFITQDVEDALPLGTLERLLDSPNYGIRDTAMTIVLARSVHEKTAIQALLWYVTRRNYAERGKGVRALKLLAQRNEATITEIDKPSTYAALVKSLEYCVTDYKHAPFDPEWDNWQFRDSVEQGCLLLLMLLIENRPLPAVDELLRTNFISHWLAKEPWGDTESERKTNFSESLGKDVPLNRICLPLFHNKGGQEQLWRAGLIPEVQFTEQRDTRMTDENQVVEASIEIRTGVGIGNRVRAQHEGLVDIHRNRTVDNQVLVEGRETSNIPEGTDLETWNRMQLANVDFDLSDPWPDPRPREQTATDDGLRRRHREAMVLNDGTRPVERGDIFERRQRPTD